MPPCRPLPARSVCLIRRANHAGHEYGHESGTGCSDCQRNGWATT
jgi:hypothetical protein